MKFTNEEVGNNEVYVIPNTDGIAPILNRLVEAAEGGKVELVINNAVDGVVTVEGVELNEGEAKAIFEFCEEFRSKNTDVKWNVLTISYGSDGVVEMKAKFDAKKFEETKEALEQVEEAEKKEEEEAKGEEGGEGAGNEGQDPELEVVVETEKGEPETIIIEEEVDEEKAEDPNEEDAEKAPATPVELPITIETPEAENMYRRPTAKLYGADGKMVQAGRLPVAKGKWTSRIQTNVLGKSMVIAGKIRSNGSRPTLGQVNRFRNTVKELSATVESFTQTQLVAYLEHRVGGAESFNASTDVKLRGFTVTPDAVVFTMNVVGLDNELTGVKLVNGQVVEIDKASVVL